MRELCLNLPTFHSVNILWNKFYDICNHCIPTTWNHPRDWSSYRDLKRITQWECRTAFNKYVASFIDENNNVTKKLWSFVKRRKQDRSGIGPLEHHGVIHTDSLSKANVLAEYFSSVFTCEDTTNVPVLEGDPLPDIQSVHIHTDGIAQLLLNLKSHKVAGPDNLPSNFLKEVANELSQLYQ